MKEITRERIEKLVAELSKITMLESREELIAMAQEYNREDLTETEKKIGLINSILLVTQKKSSEVLIETLVRLLCEDE